MISVHTLFIILQVFVISFVNNYSLMNKFEFLYKNSFKTHQQLQNYIFTVFDVSFVNHILYCLVSKHGM